MAQPITASPVESGTRRSAASISDRRRPFRALHETGCFVVPNPWDLGSARYLQQLGFPAPATTSAGFAFSQGLPDSEAALARDRNLGYIADLGAGADVLFAPGLHDPAEIRVLVEGVRPRPVNLLVARDIGPDLTDLAALGVRRVSVGGALALAAWTGVVGAAETLRKGSFAGLAGLVAYGQINDLFAADYRSR